VDDLPGDVPGGWRRQEHHRRRDVRRGAGPPVARFRDQPLLARLGQRVPEELAALAAQLRVLLASLTPDRAS